LFQNNPEGNDYSLEWDFIKLNKQYLFLLWFSLSSKIFCNYKEIHVGENIVLEKKD
jgi:hypothetical protein